MPIPGRSGHKLVGDTTDTQQQCTWKATCQMTVRNALACARADMSPHSQGWDKTYCLQFVEADGFNDIHFFGDKTFEVSAPLQSLFPHLSLIFARMGIMQ